MEEQNKMPGGYLVGNSHADGGIKIQTPEGQIEAEGGETILNKRAMSLDDEFVCKGTPKDIASKINEMEGGVSWSDSGSCELVKKGEGERKVGDDYSNWGLGEYEKEYASGGGVSTIKSEEQDLYEQIIKRYSTFTKTKKGGNIWVVKRELRYTNGIEVYSTSSVLNEIEKIKNDGFVFNRRRSSSDKLTLVYEKERKESGNTYVDTYTFVLDHLLKNGGGIGDGEKDLQEIEYLIDKIKKAKYDWYDLENEEDKKMFDLFEKHSGLTGVDDLYGLLAFKFGKGIEDLDTAKEYVSEYGAYEVFDFKKAVEFIEEVITKSKQNPNNSISKQIQKEMENAIGGNYANGGGLNIFKRETGQKSHSEDDKATVRENLRKLDTEYQNLRNEFSIGGGDYTFKDYLNDKKELIARYRPYIDRAMALGMVVNAGLLYMPTTQAADGAYTQEKKYRVFSKSNLEYPAWTGNEEEIIDFVGNKDWEQGLDDMNLSYSLIIDEVAARGTILRTQDASKRPSPSVSATIYPAGFKMEGNDGNIWEISVASNGVHRWVRSKAEDGTEIDNKFETSKTLVLNAIDSDNQNKEQLWVYLPNYDIPRDVANRFEAEFRVIYNPEKSESGYYAGYSGEDAVYYNDEDLYEYLADSVEDIKIIDDSGDDVYLDQETDAKVRQEIHRLFDKYIKGTEWESRINVVYEDVKAANGLIVSSSCGCQHANGGTIAEDGAEIDAEKWQIRNSAGKYYSVSMQTGNPIWNESPDLGYTYRKQVAETIKNKLVELGNGNLEVVEYNPNWWKMANGGGVDSRLVGKRVRLIEMQDPYAVPSGTLGTIRFIDGIGQIHVNWDNGSSLALIPGEDKYEIIDGNGGGIDDKKMYEITFEDVFSFATSVRVAQLTDSQYQKSIQQMKNKDVVVDKFNEKKGIREQLRIKKITLKFNAGGDIKKGGGEFIKDEYGNYRNAEGFELINQFDGTYQVLDPNGMDISGEYETLEQGKQTIEDYGQEMSNGGGVEDESYYIIKSWDTVEDKRNGVQPEIQKAESRIQAVKIANKTHYDMGYALVEVEDENENSIYKLSPERAENGREFWFSPDNKRLKTPKKGTAKQMIENEISNVFGATSMKQVGEDEENYIYELEGNPMMIAATTSMLEEEKGLDVETWGSKKRVRVLKRIIDLMTTRLRFPLITPYADGGNVVAGYNAKPKPTVIEDSIKSKNIREIELKLNEVDIPQAKIGGSEDAYNYFWKIWDKDYINIQEEFAILFLDRQNKVRSYHKLSKGGVASTVVDGALVVGIATKALASAVIVAHNHPSGNTKPSQSDINLTKELKDALKLVNIALLDSLIITPTEFSYYSMADEGNVFEKGGYLKNDMTRKGIYEVTLSAEPNPDFDIDSHEANVSIPEKRVKVDSLEEARDVVMNFIRNNDLGSGNWTGGAVYQNGEQIATISYNGRVWEGDTKSGQYSEIALKKKLNNGGFVISSGNRKLSRFDRGNLPYTQKWVGDKKIKKASPEKLFRFSNSSWIVFSSMEDAKNSIDSWKKEIEKDDRYGEEIKKTLLKYTESLKSKIVEKFFGGGELAAYGKEIIRSLVGKSIIIKKLQSENPSVLEVGTEGVIESIDNSGHINVRWDNSLLLPLMPGVDQYEILFSDEDLSKYMGNKGDSFLIDKANVGDKSIYYLIRATSPHHMIDLFFTTKEEALRFANKKSLIIKNKDEIAEDGKMLEKIDTEDIVNIVSSYEIIEEEGYKMINTNKDDIITSIKSTADWNDFLFFGDDQGKIYEPKDLEGKIVRVGNEVFMVPITETEKNLQNFDPDDLDSFERMVYNLDIEKGMSKTEALQNIMKSADGNYSTLSNRLAEIATAPVKIEKKVNKTYKGGPYSFNYQNDWDVEYEIDENYPIILSVKISGKDIDLDIFSDDELSEISEKAYQDFIENNSENLAKNGSILEKTYIFTHKNNPRMEIVVKLLPNMKIVDIDNDKGIRFPYSVGQILNMGHKTWACNNNYLVNGVDVCPEKKVFGIKVSDIPQNHPLRHIYPGKFK